MANEFLVKGGQCMCKFGAAPGLFTVLDNNYFYINGQKLAGSTLSLNNTFDPPGFGICKVNPIIPRPCVPMIIQWNKPYMGLKNGLGGNLLTEESTATCMSGCPDCITVMLTGQIPIPGLSDFIKATAEQQEDLDPIGESAGLTEHQIPFEVVDNIILASGSVIVETPVEPELAPLVVNSVKFVEGSDGNMIDLKEGEMARIRVRLNRPVVPGEANTFFYKYYIKNPGSGNYTREESGGSFTVPVGRDAGEVSISFPERFSGTQIAVSFYKGAPYKPRPTATQNTVRYLNIIPAGGRYEIVKACWTAEEKIPEERSGDFTRYTYASVRREICKNEDAFLHIHTRGLYGKEITVELYERDYLPRDYKLTEKTVVVKDNVVCVVFSMQEAYAAAGAYRSMWAEGGAFELYCKIKVPYQEGGAGVGITHIMTKGEDLLLKIENASIVDRISSTISGTKKFVIEQCVEDEISADSTSPYNIDDAVAKLNSIANTTSKGQCAKHVRLAIEAGGLSTNGRPTSAKDYKEFLPTLGFVVVSSEGYVPKKGDIVVLQPTTNSSAHGHIAMYNGEQWVSDFEQRDFWGGSAYRDTASHTFFRYE